jgi:aminopeptidase N
MDSLRSLTHDEAVERSQLLDVQQYDIDIDLTGLLDGDQLRCTSTVRFTAGRPGASTFVDCAAEVDRATLNGQPIGPASEQRIELSDLAPDNVLVVETVQRQTGQGTGVHRSVDPADGAVYVWMSFEPDDARRAWACFDQPDLKAPHAITVTTPADWLVVSNSGDPHRSDVQGGRRWVFPATPPLSTYVPVVNAGPFHERRAEFGGFELGLYARRSLSTLLDRDADELFDVTARGLAFFGTQFAMPFPQRSYDQVFVPDLGGAMENYGCVTWSDAYIFRSPPSPGEREHRAVVLLHEMAHMWFGDIVTMRWWDDLWLNESFAEWACHWAATSATEFGDAWATFLATSKLATYAVDRGPATHPIRQPAVDVAQAAAGFDAITYIKGASVLKQLVAYVGEDAFVAGLRAYFARYAWGNAELSDLMRLLAAASGRDLDRWTRGWLDTAGPDELSLTATEGSVVLHAVGPDGTASRPHRLAIGGYRRVPSGLESKVRLAVEIDGDQTALDGVAGSDLILVNDDDLTYAVIRPDDGSVEHLLTSAALLPTAIARAVAVATVWDLLLVGQLPARAVLRCIDAVSLAETSDTVIESYLGCALRAAELWSGDAERDELLSSLADTCLQVAEQPPSRTAALRTLARCAVTEDQLAASGGADDDVDLAWRALQRFAALGRLDRAQLAALRERDPDPDAWVRVLEVEAAEPTSAAKDAAWRTVIEERKVPVGSLGDVGRAFWQPGQADVLRPYAERYLEDLSTLNSVSMIPAMATAAAMFPVVGTDEAFVERVEEVTSTGDLSPIIVRFVTNRVDELRRMLAARS